MAEDAREDVAEAGGHGHEAGVTADRGQRRRALCRVAADADEVAATCRAAPAPEPGVTTTFTARFGTPDAMT